MPWLTHRVLRKEASFKLNPNEWFNLETKTGIRGWNSPKFVISVNKYLSTYGAVDARCEIIASTYPTFYLSNVERMGAGSEITVYVVEGNEDTINYNLSAGWTETFRIKENTMYQFEINSANNWTVPIPSNLIGKEFDIIYLPKKVYFSKSTFGYEYLATKNVNNTISFKLQETKGVLVKEKLTQSGSTPTSKNIQNCIYFYSIVGHSSGRPSSYVVTFSTTLNGINVQTPVTITSVAGRPISTRFTTPRLNTERSISYSFTSVNTEGYTVSLYSFIKYATTSLHYSEFNPDFVCIVVLLKR